MEIIENVIKNAIINRKPYSAILEVTTRCNWMCKHCFIDEHIDEGLTFEEIHQILVQLRKIGVFELTLTGGEIFTRPDILRIIKMARDMHFKLILFSNISLLDENIIEELSKLYIDEISCTVFSMKSQIHDYITGVDGSLQKTLKNAQLIRKYNIPLTIKTIIMNLNFYEWHEVEKYCVDNGFKFNLDFEVFSKLSGDDSPHELEITESQLYMEIEQLDKFRGYNKREHVLDEYVCNGIRDSMFISCKGDVSPCTKYRKVIGNVLIQDVDSLWNNAELKRIQNIKWKDLNTCKKCKNECFCIRCPGTAYLEDKDDLGKSVTACRKADIRYNIYTQKENDNENILL